MTESKAETEQRTSQAISLLQAIRKAVAENEPYNKPIAPALRDAEDKAAKIRDQSFTPCDTFIFSEDRRDLLNRMGV